MAAALAVGALVLSACTKPADAPQPVPTEVPVVQSIIPAPASVTPGEVSVFVLTDATSISTPAGSPEAVRIGEQLAGLLRRSTGLPMPVVVSATPPGKGAIALALAPADRELGDEGCQVVVTPDTVSLHAALPAGLFNAVQTLRQLLPPAVESATVQPGPWRIAATRIVDRPRFAWRGAMLDVARHFFSVTDVKRYIDLIALYKVNRLHLHLTDDQGWRIAIERWPHLAGHGGSSELGGGPGGFYTHQDYGDIVAYAAERYVTVVPEIEMPGHANAALASYAELNCDGKARDLYPGIDVGFSTLCVTDETTYRFVDEVLGEIAALTPGRYLHVGGDEVEKLNAADYVRFFERVQAIVTKHGKEMVGWEEIAQAPLLPTSVVQYWNTKGMHQGTLRAAIGRGTGLIASPASRAYLDMKYDDDTPLGLDWAGLIDVETAYDWDPTELLGGVPEAAILGVEAPLWSEEVATIEDVEFMAFPRLAGIAEVGWSPAASRDWAGYRSRVAQHAARWQAMGLHFHRASGVPWPAVSS